MMLHILHMKVFFCGRKKVEKSWQLIKRHRRIGAKQCKCETSNEIPCDMPKVPLTSYGFVDLLKVLANSAGDLFGMVSENVIL